MHKTCCHQSCSFLAQICTKSFVCGASPQTPLGELIALPRPIASLGVGPPGKGERQGRGVGEIGTPPPGTGREGKGMEGRMGWEGRAGERMEEEGRERK